MRGEPGAAASPSEERSGRAAALGFLAASGLLAGVASVAPPPLSALLAWIQRLTERLIRRYGTLGLVFVLSVSGWPDTVVLYAFGVFGIDRTRFVRSGVEHRESSIAGGPSPAATGRTGDRAGQPGPARSRRSTGEHRSKNGGDRQSSTSTSTGSTSDPDART